jgi:SAM-dependent methyltransferase
VTGVDWRGPAIAALCVLLAACATDGAHQRDHGFADAEAWARVFDDPERDAWQKPDEVIRTLRPPADATVADIGAGTGYFAVRLARAVPQGRVFAVDVEPDMLRYLASRAQREGLANLVPVWAAPDDPHLPVPVDVVLVVNTYHHIPWRVDYFRWLRYSMRPGGRLAINDYRPEAPVGPPSEMRLASTEVTTELRRAGYVLVGSHAMLPYQYFLVFAR